MPRSKTHVRYRGGARRPAEAILAELLQRRFVDHAGCLAIAVGGPGGTGKTTFARALAEQLPGAAVLRLDDYKTSREERYPRNLYGAHPEANRMELIREHLGCIREGRAFDKPVYDSEAGEARITKPFAPARFTIVDGEVATYLELRDRVDFAIFVDSDWKTQLATRISRDIESRGYSQEKAIATFLQSNLREFSAHGAESKKWADLHLYCREDYTVVVESVEEKLFAQFHDLLEPDLAPVDLSGLIVAVLTPFDDAMQFDESAFIAHVEWLAANGVQRILVNGTTGEFFSLSAAERKLALTLARRYFPGVVLFHAGSDSLVQTLEEARWGEEYGADAIAALPPYYLANAPAEGIARYFCEIGERIDAPLVLYNFPKHTGNSITAEILAQVPHAALKDSSANLELVRHTPRYFIGGDERILDCHRAGGVGFVTGRANFVPELYVAMEQSLEKRGRDSERLQEEITRGVQATAGGIPTFKAELATRLPHYPTNVRLPLIKAL
ncbi:dihydrodipicolinate synthase family protein [bacterium]|nr:dihydrodipicolinate synthase family protein [bacterium]